MCGGYWTNIICSSFSVFFLKLFTFYIPVTHHIHIWHHQMETFSALLAICEWNSLVTSEFPAQRPVTRSFDVFFDLHLNKRLSKQWWGWWFEMPSHPLWCQWNVPVTHHILIWQVSTQCSCGGTCHIWTWSQGSHNTPAMSKSFLIMHMVKSSMNHQSCSTPT